MTSSTLDADTLAAIEPLREAGFALHWLHPRTKKPIGYDWSTAPVATLADLRATHRPGNNLGVRLGEWSRLVDGRFLHTFDLDIRIAELADEAWETFEMLFPGLDPATLPTVASGSGGESRHLHVVTDKPFRSKKLAVSEGKHRDAITGKWRYDWEIELFGSGKQVAMPPSIHPDTGLPYRWINPFDLDLLALGVGPYIPAAAIERLQVAETGTYAFESREPLTFADGQMERELDLIPVSDLHYDDWITLGQAIHHQTGGSEDGFALWLLHTKRSTKYDGDDRTIRHKWRSFGRYRGGRSVTMATVRQWAQEARIANLVDQFDDLDDEEGGPPLAAEAAEGVTVSPNTIADRSDFRNDDFDALLGPSPAAETDFPEEDDSIEAAMAALSAPSSADSALEWVSLLDFNEEGAIKPTLHNVEMMIRNDSRLLGVPQINEFTQETVQRTPPGRKAKRRRNEAKDTRQLGGRVWQVKDTLNGDLWSEDRDFAIRSILEAPKTQGGYGLKVSDRDLKAAIALVANDNTFHPIREYLEATAWDGVPRVERLFIDRLGAADNSYNRDIARLMLVAAVTRIFEPGQKFDFAVIMEGLQGKRKSTFINVLGRSWFAELDGDWHDQKQLVEMMQGAWIMEIPELSGFGRADVRSIKAFISRKKDRVRLAYARRAGEFPRQCIFIGSTNDREYLKDDTGGRRFWPVQCEVAEIDTARLERDVDQIWAEATVLYREMREQQPFGTLPLYLVDTESRKEAERLQESRRVESNDDMLAGRISAWLDQPLNDGGYDDTDDTGQPRFRDVTCLLEIWVDCLNGDPKLCKTTDSATLGRAMKLVDGWVSDGSQRFTRWGKQRRYRRLGTDWLRDGVQIG